MDRHNIEVSINEGASTTSDIRNSPRQSNGGEKQVTLNRYQSAHAPPSASALLANLNNTFFETPPDRFDEKLEALSGFGEVVDAHSLSEGLLARVEEIDLAKDIVSNSLSTEVRKSASSLLAGMRQVQDLDLDITRTSLHVGGIRRRLAVSKRDLFQSSLKISTLSTKKERLKSMQGAISMLTEVKRLISERDAVTEPLSACIKVSLDALGKLRTDFPQELSAIRSAITATQNRLPRLEAKVISNLKLALLGPKLDTSVLQDVQLCFHTLAKTDNEILDISKQVWRSMLQSMLDPNRSSNMVITNKQLNTSSEGENPDIGSDKRAFLQVFDCANAYAEMLQLHAATIRDDQQEKDLFVSTRRECQSILTKLVDDYLKNPVIRSQVMDDFALTIEDASKLTEKLDVWFGEIDQTTTTQYINKTKMESSIRLRARVYAQQYQAEGFQAMRGLLWRELWVDVSSASSQGKEEDFAQAIFKRLGLQAPEMGGGKRYVFTATVASGLPRQIQRTMDLMKKLPISACGEAFLGLLRVIDLYLYAVIVLFVQKQAFMDAPKKYSKTVAWQYLNQVREMLGEWLTPISPRSSGPPPPPSSTGSAAVDDQALDQEDVRLCEMEFLEDSERSYEAAYVASESLEFVSTLVKLLEKPMGDSLPSVERSKLGSKMFVELPQVITQIQPLVRRSAVERLTQRIVFPDLGYVYGDPASDDYSSFFADEDLDRQNHHTDPASQFKMFRDVLSKLTQVYQELQGSRSIPEQVRLDLWDEACAMFLEKYLHAIARFQRCNAIDRGNMIVHLASFWEKLNEFPGSRTVLQRQGSASLRTRSRVDEYIKAFYYDKPQDLWDWMRRKKDDYEHQQFLSILETGLVGQSVSSSTSYLSTGSGTSRMIGGRKELRQEFDKLFQSLSS